MRLSAGLPTKRLEDFLEVGNRLADEATFVLGVSFVTGLDSTGNLDAKNRSLGGHVRILTNLSHAAASELVRGAGIYLGTYDPLSHPFGMPISIAEALATGALVLERDAPGVAAFMGRARLTYSSVEMAEQQVRTALMFSDDQWKDVEAESCMAAERFRPDVVLPRLIEEWNSICSDNF